MSVSLALLGWIVVMYVTATVTETRQWCKLAGDSILAPNFNT